MARHVLAGVIGAVLGAVGGWVVVLFLAEWRYRDCIEMDCLTPYLYASAAALVCGIALAVISVVVSVRRARASERTAS